MKFLLAHVSKCARVLPLICTGIMAGRACSSNYGGTHSFLASLTLALVCRVAQFSAVVAKLIVVREFPPLLLRLYSYLPSDLPCNTSYRTSRHPFSWLATSFG